MLENFILIGFNITNSFIDAYKIKVLNKNIRHGINFTVYAIITGLCIYFFKMSLWQSVLFCISAFFNRQITFDIPLNLRRGLKWNYVSLDNPPKAIMDQIEVKIFGYNGTIPPIIYALIWCITLSLQFYINF